MLICSAWCARSQSGRARDRTPLSLSFSPRDLLRRLRGGLQDRADARRALVGARVGHRPLSVVRHSRPRRRPRHQVPRARRKEQSARFFQKCVTHQVSLFLEKRVPSGPRLWEKGISRLSLRPDASAATASPPTSGRAATDTTRPNHTRAERALLARSPRFITHRASFFIHLSIFFAPSRDDDAQGGGS